MKSFNPITTATLLGTSLVLTTTFDASSAVAQTSSSVSVNVGTALSVIPGSGVGLNTAVWDGNLLDTAVPSLLTTAGIGALRFPGGSTSDDYNWQTDSIVTGQGGYANPANTFDAFMGVAKAVGATPIITVNYGSNTAGNGGGTPAFAASWVTYSNVTKGYGVKYWEVGNEVYGNGEYGGAWETDLHAAHDPTTYGANVAQYAAAMKAADPTIKVGAVLTAPGYWPDGQSPNWNTNVLAQCGTTIDFVIVHWYPQNPGSESDANLLAAPQSGINGAPGVAAMVSKLRTLIGQYAGSNAANVQILVTEMNSVSSNPGKQTLSVVNALFNADGVATWLENGVTSVDVWDLHNGSTVGNNSSSLFGTATFGDYGILSNASAGEPALDTPFATYYGLQMLKSLGKAGDTLVAATSSNSLLSAHAVHQANGNLAVLLVNKDPTNNTTANVSVAGYVPAASGSVLTYGKTSSSITSTTVTGLGSSFTVAAAPYSLTTVVLSPGSTGAPPSFALTDGSGTLSLPAGSAGSTTVSVNPSGGFNGSVALSVSGLPSGVTASFSPATTSTASTLSLTAASTATVGTSNVTITGTSGSLTKSLVLPLTITAAKTSGGPATFKGNPSANSPWFDEDDVLLTSTAPITALTVTITVPATNVTYGSSYDTVGNQIVTSHTSGSNIVYVYTLTKGQTIYPGSYTFAAQMDGNGKAHLASGDSWSVSYSTGGVTYTQSGSM